MSDINISLSASRISEVNNRRVDKQQIGTNPNDRKDNKNNISVNQTDSTGSIEHIYNEKIQKSQDGDTLSISDKGEELEASEADKDIIKKAEEDQKKKQEEDYKKQLEEQKEAAKDQGDNLQEMAKVIEIARRISNGDKVPYTDEKKLMEYNNKLYMMAKAAAAVNQYRKHKEYGSVYDDEKDKDKEEKLRELEKESDQAKEDEDAVTEGTSDQPNSSIKLDSSSDLASVPDFKII